jgi:hypothetical protein
MTVGAGRVRASTVACRGLTPDPGPGHPGRHRIGSRGSAGLGLSHEHQMHLFDRGGNGGWPVAGSATAALPSCLPYSPTMGQTFQPGTLPATVARPGQLGSLNRRSAPFTGTSRAGATGLEPATSGVTGRRSNQLSYAPGGGFHSIAGHFGFGRPDVWAGRGEPGREGASRASGAGATFGPPASLSQRIDLRRTCPTRPWARCWDQRRGPFGVPVVVLGQVGRLVAASGIGAGSVDFRTGTWDVLGCARAAGQGCPASRSHGRRAQRGPC